MSQPLDASLPDSKNSPGSGTNRSLFLFYLAAVLFHMASSFAHPVTPTLIVERQLDSSMFGIALAAMMMMQFLFAPFWGKLCRCVSSRYILAVCGAGYAVGQIVFGLAQTEAVVILGRMFAGIFVGGFFVGLMNYVVNVSKDGTSSRSLTILATIQSVCGAAGYFVGGLLGAISVEAAFWVQAATLLFCGLMLLFVCRDDAADSQQKPSLRLLARQANPFSALLRCRRFLTSSLLMFFLAVALCSIGQNAFDQCFNFYIRDQLGLSSVYNGVFKALVALVCLLVNSTLSMMLIRRFSLRRVITPVIVCCTLSMASILVTKSLSAFVAVNVLFFACNAVRLPLQQSLAASAGTPENRSEMLGFYQSMNSLGGIFGALFAGLMYAASPKLPFLFGAIAMALAALCSLFYALSANRPDFFRKKP